MKDEHIMKDEHKSFDSVWEDKIYSQGRHLNRYPFDVVVSFVYEHFPRQKDRSEVEILEVGCGAGNNLWFMAREGFKVTGIDVSHSAISYAQDRFSEEELEGNFHVGDFTQLPFEDCSFDLAIDRGSITCCGKSAAQKAVQEVERVLSRKGKFLCNPYSTRHSSYLAGDPGPDGVTMNINDGTLVGVGQICFYEKREVNALFSNKWKLLSVHHMELVDEKEACNSVHAEWRVVAQKV